MKRTTHLPILRDRRTAADRSEIDGGVCHHKHWHVSYTSRKAGWLICIFFARNYVPLVDLVGIWFQIRDDYMNLQSNTVGKPCLAVQSADARHSVQGAQGIC